VHRVGGLADTVVNASPAPLEAGQATGFAFDDFSAAGLRAALRHAFDVFAQPATWRSLQQNAMKQRFDWQQAASHYVAVYRSIMPPAGLRPEIACGTDPLPATDEPPYPS